MAVVSNRRFSEMLTNSTASAESLKGTRRSSLVSTVPVKERNTGIWRMVVALAVLISIASCLTWLTALPSSPHLVDQVDRPMMPRNSAPIIVVGVLASDKLIRKPVPMRSDPTYPLQLRRLTVHVENVLRGSPIPNVIAVYYFAFAGGFDGPEPLGNWTPGARRILWLQKDSGVLRTVCDGWNYCTQRVGTGAHLNYRPDPQKALDYALLDILSTRGEGAVNENSFGTELDEVGDQVPGLQAYSIAKLRHLALTEHGYIRSCACQMLWLYTVDLVKPPIKQDAENAMHDANCRCIKTPDGNERCE